MDPLPCDFLSVHPFSRTVTTISLSVECAERKGIYRLRSLVGAQNTAPQARDEAAL